MQIIPMLGAVFISGVSSSFFGSVSCRTSLTVIFWRLKYCRFVRVELVRKAKILVGVSGCVWSQVLMSLVGWRGLPGSM